MPEFKINEVTLIYEVLGQGSPVVYTPGGFDTKESPRPLAERLAERYQVLIYDRPLCGQSDAVIAGDSLHEMWAENLYRLLDHLNMLPAYIGGSSMGLMLSLRFAHRFPDAVRGLLLLNAPVDDYAIWREFGESFSQCATVAEANGMKAAIETAFSGMVDWPRVIAENPANEARLLAMEPVEFATVMRRWGSALIANKPHFAGLTDADIQNITIPAIVAPGLDTIHPQHVAEALYRLLPNAEMIVLDDHFSAEEVKQLQEWRQTGEGGDRYEAALAPILDKFIQRVEGSRLS